MKKKDVLDIQAKLNELGFNLKVDGIFGDKTKDAIVTFQEQSGLYADGIVGAITTRALFKENFSDVKKKFKFKKIVCDPYDVSVGVTYLRADAAESFRNVKKSVQSAGGLITSSGGRRLLSASAKNPNRSQTSLHYFGLAHDLNVQSGMKDPYKDPYVIEYIGDYQWRVWARASGGPLVSVTAMTYDRKKVTVTDNLIDLTSIMESNGWKPIRARASFFTRENKMGAEWWHFQYEDGLQNGTLLGDELLKSFKLKKVSQYPIWKFRDLRWKKDWF